MSGNETRPKDNGELRGEAAVPASTPRRKGSRGVRLLVLAVVLGIGWGIYRVATWDPYYVTHVDEGDRVILRSNEGLYLVGIRCLPQKEGTLGLEAAELASDLILEKRIIVEEATTSRDDAGWILGYVFVERDGKRIFVNEELVRRGLAIAKPRGLNTRYRERFDAAEKEARDARRGIWHPDNKHLLEILRRAD